MKKIGILFAMQEELDALLKYVKVNKTYSIYDLTLYEGEVNHVICVMVECGIGKVNAARTTQVLIDHMKVDFVFNIGVAGGIVDSLSVMDVVIAKSLVQHDFDITAFDHEKGYIPKIGTHIKCDAYLFQLATKVLHEMKNIVLKSGVIASGDIFCTDQFRSKKIASTFQACCVEMEGAAVAQVCYLSSVPFLIIRSISDVLGTQNVITYEEFLKISSEKVALAMYEIIKKI